MKVTATKTTTPVVDRPERRSQTQRLIDQLVREAPDGAAAWERLMVGVDLERGNDGTTLVVQTLMSPERLAANNAAMLVDYRIGQGWIYLADRIPHPRSAVDLLKDLHGESLAKLRELDAIRRAENEAAGKPVSSGLADILHRAVCEAEMYLKGLVDVPNDVWLALEAVGIAFDLGDEDAAFSCAVAYVWAAVEAKYAAGGIDEDA